MPRANLASSCVIDFTIESGQILLQGHKPWVPTSAGATLPTVSFESRTPFGSAG